MLHFQTLLDVQKCPVGYGKHKLGRIRPNQFNGWGPIIDPACLLKSRLNQITSFKYIFADTK